MALVQSAAVTLKTEENKTSELITSVVNQVDEFSNTLAKIEQDINRQKAALQGRLGNARSEESAAKKKYYWLIALGPFGLAGLAVALGLYLKWKHDVSDLESQASSLEAQISRQNMMITAIKQLGTDFNNLADKVSSIKNVVDFVASDINEVIADISDPKSTRLIIKLHITMTTQEVNTLAIDAS